MLRATVTRRWCVDWISQYRETSYHEFLNRFPRSPRSVRRAPVFVWSSLSPSEAFSQFRYYFQNPNQPLRRNGVQTENLCCLFFYDTAAGNRGTRGCSSAVARNAFYADAAVPKTACDQRPPGTRHGSCRPRDGSGRDHDHGHNLGGRVEQPAVVGTTGAPQAGGGDEPGGPEAGAAEAAREHNEEQHRAGAAGHLLAECGVVRAATHARPLAAAGASRPGECATPR